ncbi:hypothetical protein [Herminiimonas sp. CN]|uniref:hypothetical protein n=1 Tax=Herminiimonas sp. CN TaxID=1349818 RepID=UPI0012DCC1DA|nr:hypothetical protein [Herminiimonas sp. CN]
MRTIGATKKINSDQKNAHWQQYQQLPEDQKKELAAAVINKKRGASVPSAHKNNDNLLVKPKKIPPLPEQAPVRDSSILTPSVPPDAK